MKKIRLITALIIVFFIGIRAANATHIVGGEITYTCLGDSLYEVKLSVYRDCFNGVPPFDDPASLGIADANYQILYDVLINWNQTDDTLLIYLNNPCLTRPPDICVHRTTYTTIVKLPPSPGGYKLVYQRCCRNKLIRNLPFPEDVGITIISEITDKSLMECNSSAVYNNWPPLAICAHEPVDFDHSANDPDGDSLAYRLCTPLTGGTPDIPIPQPPNSGPYVEVTWQPPYDLNNLLGGVPLAIDPVTGFMTGVPNTVGNFVVGVCVDEFRDGVVISTTRRDFQYNVADCGVPVAAYIAPAKQCNNNTVELKNLTDLNNLGISNWYFDWGGDLSLFSTEKNPVFTYPDTGRYEVALIINPGYSCTDTIIKEVWITKTTATADMNILFPECNNGSVQISLQDQSTDPQHGINNLLWYITGPNQFSASFTDSNPIFKVTKAGNYIVQLTATGNNGCNDEITIPFNIPFTPGAPLSAVYSICAGDNIGLYPDADPSLTYEWLPSPDITNTMIANPVVSPIVSTIYQVKITKPGMACEWIRTVEVQVLSSGALTATATPSTILAGESSQLLAVFPGSVSYQWSPAGTLSADNIINPVATPPVTTDYLVVISSSSGCTQEATVRVNVLSPVCDEPYVFFPTGFSPNGDTENDILKMESRFVEEVFWMIYNRWGEKVFEANSIDEFWDGKYQGKDQPAETYGYYYRIRCLDGQVKEKKGNVTLIR